MVTLRNQLSILSDPQKSSTEKTNVEVIGAAVGNLHGPTSERLFAGPKELDVLQKIPVPGVTGGDNDLNGLVDFGWWGIIAKPLFVWLKWTYHHVVANWGWAIVLQTLIISVALLPLRITQMKSMLKMQRVAPADQVDPGEVQEVQPAGSAQGADERRDQRASTREKE